MQVLRKFSKDIIMADTDDYMISAVPIPLLEVIWPRCIEHIQRVVDRAHGEISLDSVKARLLRGDALLITISKGTDIVAVNTMEVRNFETGTKAMFIPITGGRDLDEWMPRFLEVAKAIAREHGCNELRGLSVRPGWLRKLSKYGWETVHTVIKCKIED